ncbi:MAG: tannase/feruloyl esterase family alpha/beta hydrolase [Acidobacteria bacterium]|nr:tannase/feruloyl esterase family alpha/beta hydrolase [Acidobacteriota bacterium]
MRKKRWHSVAFLVVLLSSWRAALGWGAPADPDMSGDEATCRVLAKLPNLTILSAELVGPTDTGPQYCYLRGIISPAIHFHVQLPLPRNWNGRFLKWGDGGKDGDLDFADHRVAQGYAVANSNMGHDNGAEPGASFAHNNRQAEIDFGYRAVHLTANAAKTVIKAYYGRDPQYSYFEGCSAGGREGLMEAQRFPYDFDGIVAGAPVNFYTARSVTSVWFLQKLYSDNFAGNLAFDRDGDGVPESLTKLNMLREAVLAKCDARDGIVDGVIDDPVVCDFKPEVDLAGKTCRGDVNADDCFTELQLKTIKDIYRGSYDSKGNPIFKGYALGSEFSWTQNIIPYAGNKLYPALTGLSGDHLNYLFYEKDPGVVPPDRTDLAHVPDKKTNPPEWAWWEFNIDDFTAGKGKFMASIIDATDPNLTRFLIRKGGKLILYHGWGDTQPHPEPTLDYYKDVVKTTFHGDVNAARERSRLFMIPGMGHCRGGPGPNDWDKLAPLVEWVEKGKAPNYVVAVHRAEDGKGKVDNERKVCAYPQKTVYTGPGGDQNNPANWLEKNFTCK